MNCQSSQYLRNKGVTDDDSMSRMRVRNIRVVLILAKSVVDRKW
jgi:hypothetical protein